MVGGGGGFPPLFNRTIIEFLTHKLIKMNKKEMIGISEKLEILTKKSDKCFDLYDAILNRTQEIANHIVGKLERARVPIEKFGFGYRKGRYNNYLCYDDELIQGYSNHKGGGYDGGDFNYWIGQTSKNAIFACAKAIEEGLLDDVIAYLSEIEEKRTGTLATLEIVAKEII